MITKLTKYDKIKDIKPVDQFGFIDLRKSFEYGYVPGEADINESDYNDIDNPASIIGKPTDAFEAMRMQDYVMSGVKSAGAADVNQSSERDEN